MIWLAAYVATIVGANWSISTFGVVPVGFGLMAPAAAYVAGLTFTLRDLAQESAGRGWTIVAIIVGAALSAAVSPQLALASGAAFLVSETADLVVYTPLRRRHFLGAVAASNAVGLTIDTALFLWLAFGSLDLLAGGVLGKLWATLVALALLGGLRGRRRLSISAAA